VAVTRARQRLYLSLAQTRMLHGQTRYNIASRFIEEIPEGLLKWLTPKVKPASNNEGYGGYSSGYSAGNYSRGRSSGSSGNHYGNSAPAEPAPRRRNAEYGGFHIGQNVMHAKFGAGVILNAEGSGSDTRVQVNFGAAGTKWLALSVAKLDAI
jgi:DNA helicase-2/ATP-dependent DNA helicase PcrA